jgi:hypothetical protein
MPYYSFDTLVPDASSRPSTSPANFQTNFTSINGWNAVDHYGFKNNFGGYHKQVTFPDFITTPSSLGTTVSVAYEKAGVADTTHPQLYWTNAVGNFLLSGLKAFANCNGSGTILGSQSINIASISGSAGDYTINLTTGAVQSSNYSVLITCSERSGGTDCMVGILDTHYSTPSTTSFKIRTIDPITNNAAAPTRFSVFVYEI